MDRETCLYIRSHKSSHVPLANLKHIYNRGFLIFTHFDDGVDELKYNVLSFLGYGGYYFCQNLIHSVKIVAASAVTGIPKPFNLQSSGLREFYEIP